MGRTLTQYQTRIRDRINDAGVLQYFAPAGFELSLEEAISQLSNDFPREVEHEFTGDNSAYDFDLADATDDPFITEWSRVSSVEYPADQRQPEYLVEGQEWILLKLSKTVRLLDETPATSETVKVIFTARWPFPTDDEATDLLPTVYSDALITLAASMTIRAKGVQIAAKQSTSVLGQVTATDAQSLFTAAGQLKKAYETAVLGRPAGSGAPPQIAYAETEIDTFPNALFHRRTRG